MIEILTLFLGLFSGEQTVELKVADPVARVEVWLDGKPQGKVSKPPWRFELDLGSDLRPHELMLVARDAELRELQRTRRWINLELEPPDDSTAETREELTPVAIALGESATLPGIAQMQGWFTAAGEPLQVVRVDDKGEADLWIVRDPLTQPFLERLATFFFQLSLSDEEYWDDVPLVEKDAFVVAAKQKLGRQIQLASRSPAEVAWERWNAHLGLGDDVDIRFIEPNAVPVSRVARRKQVFGSMPDLPSQGDGLLWHAVRVRPLGFQLRIADAVAMAGLEAHVGHRRRAVLLILEDEQKGLSRYTPAAVESYFRDLGVPLFVWAFRDQADHEMPMPDEVSSEASAADPAIWSNIRTILFPEQVHERSRRAYLVQAEVALLELRANLERQRVVWLRGAHLPHRIEISDAVVGVSMEGGGS